MSRKIVAVTFAAARKAELAGAWSRLGFRLDDAVIGLADGATLDFCASDDPDEPRAGDLQKRAFLAHAAARGGAALVGFSGEPDGVLTARPQSFGGPDCLFQIAAARQTKAGVQPNGAICLKCVTALAEDPADHAEWLAKVTGQREMLATSAGLEIKLDGGGRFDVLTPAAFAFRFGSTPSSGAVFRIAGLTFGVANAAETEKYLHAQGIETTVRAGRLVASGNPGVAVGLEQI